MRAVGLGMLFVLILSACNLGMPGEAATGEQIYETLCARCHGADLSGGLGPALGPGSTAAEEGDEFLEFTIVNGRGRMPSFPSLSEEQLDRLVGYLREVQGK